MSEKLHVVSFSGGKDSTAMLLGMVERGMAIDEVVFVDTTKEFPGMYYHIDKLEQFTGIEITRLSFDFDYWMKDHVKTKGKNKGKIGYGWPDFRNRWCTALKRQTVKRHLKNIPSAVQYHGIAFDEVGRTERNRGAEVRYPLVEWGMTASDNLQYCYDKGFDWGGLYERFHRVSCFCCPLSRIGELRILYRDYPDLWEKIRKMDMKSYRRFRSDYSFKELEKKFWKEAEE